MRDLPIDQSQLCQFSWDHLATNHTLYPQEAAHPFPLIELSTHNEFVELQRQFRPLSDAELEDTEHLVALEEFGYGSTIGWSDLRKYSRVILLAGRAGKSREMEQQKELLTSEGMYAFFVPLESLSRRPVSDNPFADGNKFQQWKADGQEPVWFSSTRWMS